MAEVRRRLRAITRGWGGPQPEEPHEERLRELTQALSDLLLETRPGDERWVAEARRLVAACRQLAGGEDEPAAQGSASAPNLRDAGRLLASLDIVEAGLRRGRPDVLDRGYVMLEHARRAADTRARRGGG